MSTAIRVESPDGQRVLHSQRQSDHPRRPCLRRDPPGVPWHPGGLRQDGQPRRPRRRDRRHQRRRDEAGVHWSGRPLSEHGRGDGRGNRHRPPRRADVPGCHRRRRQGRARRQRAGVDARRHSARRACRASGQRPRDAVRHVGKRVGQDDHRATADGHAGGDRHPRPDLRHRVPAQPERQRHPPLQRGGGGVGELCGRRRHAAQHRGGRGRGAVRRYGDALGAGLPGGGPCRCHHGRRDCGQLGTGRWRAGRRSQPFAESGGAGHDQRAGGCGPSGRGGREATATRT